MQQTSVCCFVCIIILCNLVKSQPCVQQCTVLHTFFFNSCLLIHTCRAFYLVQVIVSVVMQASEWNCFFPRLNRRILILNICSKPKLVWIPITFIVLSCIPLNKNDDILREFFFEPNWSRPCISSVLKLHQKIFSIYCKRSYEFRKPYWYNFHMRHFRAFSLVLIVILSEEKSELHSE